MIVSEKSEQVMETFFIVNPKAGNNRMGSIWKSYQKHPAVSGWEFTTSAEDATRMAREAASWGMKAVVACGGDGTLHHVLQGVMACRHEKRPAVGVFPCGTANDLARSLGMPLSLKRAIEVLKVGNTRTVDVGIAQTQTRKCFFLVAAFVGAGATIAKLANTQGKKSKGLLGYLPYVPRVVRFSSDVVIRFGEMSWKGSILSVEVANVRLGGGGIPVNPDATPYDGQLDMMIIERKGALDTLRLLSALKKGTHNSLPFVHHRRVTEAVILGSDLELAADGEMLGALPGYISIKPAALNFIVPPSETNSENDF